MEGETMVNDIQKVWHIMPPAERKQAPAPLRSACFFTLSPTTTS
jgi:hypothetical protein